MAGYVNAAAKVLLAVINLRLSISVLFIAKVIACRVFEKLIILMFYIKNIEV
jgi:hypothetical protein